ncbi:MAG: MarR family transcriptional regulator [Nevskiaceae bacterium]|jgi:DNA-binding MarR family transcriptional regulator|nr:MarR family transcriptional regulator [Nevskiaceae bacterium]
MDKSQSIGLLLKDLSQLYAARFEQHARTLSLTLMHCKVLVHLERDEGVSQARLADLVSVDAMTIVRLIDRMEQAHLVERRADPGDRRTRRLFLTARARPILEQVWRLAAQVRAEMFSGVPRAQREIFLRVLETAHHNLSNIDPKAN